MAAGVSTVDAPVSGCNGGTATSAGPCCSGGVTGQSTSMTSAAAMKATTTTAVPAMTVRNYMTRAGANGGVPLV